jgi:hypothetical protein
MQTHGPQIVDERSWWIVEVFICIVALIAVLALGGH